MGIGVEGRALSNKDMAGIVNPNRHTTQIYAIGEIRGIFK